MPASVTFILKATKLVPKLLVNSKKNTIGIRVPQHAIAEAILGEMDEPLFVTTAKLPDVDLDEIRDPDLFQRAFDKLVDVMVDDEQPVLFTPSTVVDLSDSPVTIIRQGSDFDR
ncbi:Sua5/YciO/YrdC/YwlC family protein, partial [Arthrospira platensis SPKY1]|nr:Sua5/YciO/YrdC/YwlC family protein [Arthrospira platensis SPKY1]